MSTALIQSSSQSPPTLVEATGASTSAWQTDLASLFWDARERFGDVVWEADPNLGSGLGIDRALLDGYDDEKRTEKRRDQSGSSTKGKEKDEVWGHKAIIYARAPPSFQARYFQSSNSMESSFSLAQTTTLSLSLAVPEQGYTSRNGSRSPSPRPGSRIDTPSKLNGEKGTANSGTILRLKTPENSALFAQELEYLYTGRGFGGVFEFLFDQDSGDLDDSNLLLGEDDRREKSQEDRRIDKLRKDLVFMWRSRLYSDIRISLDGTGSHGETAVFSSHRFILVSRSRWFHDALISWPGNKSGAPKREISLPSPPFTPASLHFTLGFIYTGTLVFSHRSYDLSTAFSILVSAMYLGGKGDDAMKTLEDEIQARLVEEMGHGLFHAYLEFADFEKETNGVWGAGGCRCRQCARRAPRILEFAIRDDVKNKILERGARRALTGIWGEGWVTSELGGMDGKIVDSLIKGVGKRALGPAEGAWNVMPMIWAGIAGTKKADRVVDTWGSVVRDALEKGRKGLCKILADHSESAFECPEWTEIMEADGVRFEDGERVEGVLAALLEGLSIHNAGTAYQTLVSSVLLKPHPVDRDKAMLGQTSHVRIQVEQARVDILSWLRRRWVNVRAEGGFESLEGWAVKEIADYLEVPLEDLLIPPKQRPDSKLTPAEPSTRSPSISRASMSSRTSVATPTRPKRAPPPPPISPANSTSFNLDNGDNLDDPVPDEEEPSVPKTAPARTAAKTPLRGASSTASGSRTPSLRPTSAMSSRSAVSTRSRAASIAASVKSNATLKKTRAAAAAATLKPLDARASTASTDTGTFRTPRSRTASVSSAISTKSGVSVRTTASAKSGTSVKTARGGSVVSPRPPSVRSVRSTAPSVRSTTSTMSTAASNAKKVVKPEFRVPALPTRTTPNRSTTTSTPPTSRITSKVSPGTKKDPVVLKGKARASVYESPLKRKESSNTVPKDAEKKPEDYPEHLGTTLDIGIACIVQLDDKIPNSVLTSNKRPGPAQPLKRKRFRAFARYIGAVEGEGGWWVGVEVPAAIVAANEGHDGTWRGVRYFSPQTAGLKRPSESGGVSGGRSKRLRSASPFGDSRPLEGETRGLFVRPNNVLYVVEAEGDL
ncbi:hypothetical protein C8J56DRAFT_498559 [Mycena floridula]|nr:hypothetical protein C8J56DRAFT_498559 [Mycena floridula]